MRQHLACVQAAAEVSGAQVEGAELGATALRFAPGPVRAGDYRFAIAGAGSCLLVLQTVLPALLRADGPSRLVLTGGTHNPRAPPFHFLARAYAPLVARLSAGLELTLHRCGFYPAGGGEVHAQITPASGLLRPFDLLARGALQEAYAECLAPALPRQVAARELDTLAALTGWPRAQLRVADARQNEGPGNALLVTLVYEQLTEVFMALGQKSVTAEEVARRMVREMRGYQSCTGAAVGPHLADQLVLLLALACAPGWGAGSRAAFTCSEVTAHTRTHCALIERFLPLRFAIEREGDAHRIEVVRCA
jgi:RNA 3'-terminal phosphate cyclase (ATP)